MFWPSPFLGKLYLKQKLKSLLANLQSHFSCKSMQWLLTAAQGKRLKLKKMGKLTAYR